MNTGFKRFDDELLNDDSCRVPKAVRTGESGGVLARGDEGYQACDDAGEGAESAGSESTLGERRLRPLCETGELLKGYGASESSRVVGAQTGRSIMGAINFSLRMRSGRLFSFTGRMSGSGVGWRGMLGIVANIQTNKQLQVIQLASEIGCMSTSRPMRIHISSLCRVRERVRIKRGRG